MAINIPLILSVLPILILLCAAYGDLRSRTIEHWIVIAMAVTAPLFWWSLHLPILPDYAWGAHPWLQFASLFDPASVVMIVALAFATLFFFMLFFVAGWMGGGDVKLLAALALWLMPWELPKMLVIEAIAGVVVTIAAAIHHHGNHKPGKTEVPRGIAIAFAGIWIIVERYFNQFG
ncbi:A24 family peptidase [Aquisediminimonas sediminicola]|uniref:A24 family peptidase n=1 Tax=Alteraquisediminimonas sediminicola TaxID=2676787 RepID=UPI001C8EF44F|nr:prepilin peptidase [Aquisediminimonas sediminicola]